MLSGIASQHPGTQKLITVEVSARALASISILITDPSCSEVGADVLISTAVVLMMVATAHLVLVTARQFRSPQLALLLTLNGFTSRVSRCKALYDIGICMHKNVRQAHLYHPRSH